MKSHFRQEPCPPVPSFSTPSVSLYSMVSRLQTGLLPQAVDKKSLIINDVDKGLALRADENILAYVVGSILSNAVFSSSSSCIRVETVWDEGAVTLRVRNNGAFTYHPGMYSLGNILHAARRIGGDIGLQTEAGGGLTVVFTLHTGSYQLSAHPLKGAPGGPHTGGQQQ